MFFVTDLPYGILIRSTGLLGRAIAAAFAANVCQGEMIMTKITTGGSMETTREFESGYAPVNGLQMYYEIHGLGHEQGQPLVLIHGAFSAIGTSFGAILPGLSESRQVIAFELQGHGRTADIDRPLSIEQMADDTAAALRHLGIEQADIFGYSMGAFVALHLAIRHPQVARK